MATTNPSDGLQQPAVDLDKLRPTITAPGQLRAPAVDLNKLRSTAAALAQLRAPAADVSVVRTAIAALTVPPVDVEELQAIMAAIPSPTDLQALFVELEELRPQPNETNRAYAAFKDYCALGPGRSVRELWTGYTKQKRAYNEQKKAASKRRRKSESPAENATTPLTLPPTTTRRTLEEWCAVNEWVKRVRIYEDGLGKMGRVLEIKALTEMNARHTNFALAMLNVAAERMQATQGDELSITELRLYIAEAIRLERLARGAENAELLTAAESAAGAKVRSGRFRIVEIIKDYGETPPPTDE